MATDMTVSKTIAEQLGKPTLFMLGALADLKKRPLVGGENSLMFSIMRGAKNGINKIRIVLEPSDTYTVEFIKVGRAPRYEVKLVSKHEGIYVDALHDLIYRETDLEVRVPRVRGIN